MFKKLYNKTMTLSHSDVRLVLFVLTLMGFVIGAGAPSDGGGFGGG